MDEFLRLSDLLRPGYSATLGQANGTELGQHFKISAGAVPKFITNIYSKYLGTRSSTANQAMMDFIPGYRLIHVEELLHEWQVVHHRHDQPTCFPFLANYSSDHICWCNGEIVDSSSEQDSPELLHQSEASFFQTIEEFYRQKVYFLDADGYLDYDFDEQGRIGAALNPGVGYWLE